jgi:uncharacterized protein (DUF2235 family)
MIGRRLALFFDGTWDSPGSNSNVWRLYLMLAERDAEGVVQRSFYDEGVGTHWFDRMSGGAFGFGLSQNVRRGYRWLMQNYEPGDEIYVFGFSRGAFTARALVGLIAKCGLLRPEAPMSFMEIFDRYRKGVAVDPIYSLIRKRDAGKPIDDFEERTLLDHAWYRSGLVKMIGVWDTVGSLGIPLGRIPGVSRNTLSFYNTNLTTVAQHCFHALALDEERKDYWGMLWTMFYPSIDAARAAIHDPRTIEQRWFSGAHCNVGGGYAHDYMAQRPLAWMQGKATDLGLAFRSRVAADDDLKSKPRDSYAEFLCGAYRFVRRPRYIRWVKSNPVQKSGSTQIENGWVETVNERLDFSIIERCRLDPKYRPSSLIEWTNRKGMKIEDLIESPDQSRAIFEPRTLPGIETTISL